MSRFISSAIMVCGLIPSLPSSFVAQDSKGDDKAKDIYGQFVKAMKNKEFENIMKVIDVPFIDSSKQIIMDKKVLAEDMKTFTKEAKDTSEWKADIKKILSYPKFREMFKENDDNRDALKLLDEMKLTADDRVVMETFKVILIRIRKGEAKVVGILE